MAAKSKVKSAGAATVQKVTVRVEAPDVAEGLVLALQKAFDMAPEDAAAVAEVVGERFAGQAEVNDETLDAEVRSLFYTLEAKRLLSFRREEYENDMGEKRRAFWWRIRADVVEELLAPEPAALNEDIYAQLPAECWSRAKAEPKAEAA